MNNSTLVMVAALAAIAMMAAVVVVLPIQQASAQDTEFSFEQRQSNRCSGAAFCSNEGTINFGF
jgi:membrane protease subunit (stomatin/prohibitin family)